MATEEEKELKKEEKELKKAEEQETVQENTEAAKEQVEKFLNKEVVDVTSVALKGLFVLALFYTLYFARAFLLPVTLAALLSFLLKPLIRGLKRIGITESIGAGIVLLAFIGVVAGGALILSEPASQWMAKLPESLENLEKRVRRLGKPATTFTKAAESVEKMTKVEGDSASEPVQKVEIKKRGALDILTQYAVEFLVSLGEMLVLLYFLLASGDLFIRKLIKILPGLSEKREAVEIARETEGLISSYLVTVTIINVVEGIIIGVGMAIVGMPNPFLWGVMAAIFNYIPYVGALAGIAVVTLVSFLNFQQFGQAIIPPLIYLSVNLAENFVTPFIQGHRLKLNPVLVFLSISFWGWMWGVTGVFLAVPILMTFKIFCDHIPPLAPVGEFLGN